MAVLPCLSKRPSARYQSETREKRRPARSVVASINPVEFSHGLLGFCARGAGVKKRVLLVHGLGGSAEGTWRLFPELIENDAELSARYDVHSFQYSSSIAGPTPSLQTCADALKTEIEIRYKDYPSIAIIAHSQVTARAA